MTRISWNSTGERTFETGVDRGVFYPLLGEGVAWNGLIAVREAVSGGEAEPYYHDGVKYMNRSSPEEFEGSIEAFTYPDEFAVCDGTVTLVDGLQVTQQRRHPFDLTYRTLVGNDVDSTNHGYKIHFVYNVLAEPTEREYDTEDDTIDAMTFSWDFTTTPIVVDTVHRPASHFIVNTTTADPAKITELEDILYGTVDDSARMIRPEELIELFHDIPEDEFTLTFGGSF